MPGWPLGWAALEGLAVWLQQWHSALPSPGCGVTCSVILKEKQHPTTPGPVPLAWRHPPWEKGQLHAGNHEHTLVPSLPAPCSLQGASPRRQL